MDAKTKRARQIRRRIRKLEAERDRGTSFRRYRTIKLAIQRHKERLHKTLSHDEVTP